MTPHPPHPQRCETCRHYNDETESEYGMCYAESGHREQMYNNTYDHVSKYGCASHSSPPAAAPVPGSKCCEKCVKFQQELTVKMIDTAAAKARADTLDAFLKELWQDHIIHPDSPEGKYLKRKAEAQQPREGERS